MLGKKSMKRIENEKSSYPFTNHVVGGVLRPTALVTAVDRYSRTGGCAASPGSETQPALIHPIGRVSDAACVVLYMKEKGIGDAKKSFVAKTLGEPASMSSCRFVLGPTWMRASSARVAANSGRCDPKELTTEHSIQGGKDVSTWILWNGFGQTVVTPYRCAENHKRRCQLDSRGRK